MQTKIRLMGITGFLQDSSVLGDGNLSICIQNIHCKAVVFWYSSKSHFPFQETVVEGSKITWLGWYYLCPHWISTNVSPHVPFSSSSPPSSSFFLNRYKFCVGECPDSGLAYRVQQWWILQVVWLSQGGSDAKKQYLQVFMIGAVLLDNPSRYL